MIQVYWQQSVLALRCTITIGSAEGVSYALASECLVQARDMHVASATQLFFSFKLSVKQKPEIAESIIRHFDKRIIRQFDKIEAI